MTFDFASSHPHTSPLEDSYPQEMRYAGLQIRTPLRRSEPVCQAKEKSSPLLDHISRAEDLMNRGDYNAAYKELEAAANRFLTYKAKINDTFNQSIACLTTLGSRATAPHPKALPLTRLRRELTA